MLDAPFHDAADLRLIRAGTTLRHRTGEGSAAGGGRSRCRCRARASRVVGWRSRSTARRATVPDHLASAVRGASAGRRSGQVAHLHTKRTVVGSTTADRPLAEVSDDEVSALDGDEVGWRFREVEVEAAAGAPGQRARRRRGRLRAAGAGGADPTAQARAGARTASAGARRSRRPVRGHARHHAAFVQAALAGSVQRLLLHDPLVRLDAGTVGVHQARVARRRLRSDLRTFRELLAPGFGEALVDDLRGLGGHLGAVRDTDVLLARLDRGGPASTRPTRRPAPAPRAPAPTRQPLLAGSTRGSTARATSRCSTAWSTAASTPPVLREADGPARRTPAEAGRPARGARCASGPTQLGADATDAQLHELRIAAKRMRYAAEAAAAVIPAAAAPRRDPRRAAGRARRAARRRRGRAVAAGRRSRRGQPGPGARRRPARRRAAQEALARSTGAGGTTAWAEADARS